MPLATTDHIVKQLRKQLASYLILTEMPKTSTPARQNYINQVTVQYNTVLGKLQELPVDIIDIIRLAIRLSHTVWQHKDQQGQVANRSTIAQVKKNSLNQEPILIDAYCLCQSLIQVLCYTDINLNRRDFLTDERYELLDHFISQNDSSDKANLYIKLLHETSKNPHQQKYLRALNEAKAFSDSCITPAKYADTLQDENSRLFFYIFRICFYDDKRAIGPLIDILQQIPNPTLTLLSLSFPSTILESLVRQFSIYCDAAQIEAINGLAMPQLKVNDSHKKGIEQTTFAKLREQLNQYYGNLSTHNQTADIQKTCKLIQDTLDNISNIQPSWNDTNTIDYTALFNDLFCVAPLLQLDAGIFAKLMEIFSSVKPYKENITRLKHIVLSSKGNKESVNDYMAFIHQFTHTVDQRANQNYYELLQHCIIEHEYEASDEELYELSLYKSIHAIAVLEKIALVDKTKMTSLLYYILTFNAHVGINSAILNNKFFNEVKEVVSKYRDWPLLKLCLADVKSSLNLSAILAFCETLTYSKANDPDATADNSATQEVTLGPQSPSYSSEQAVNYIARLPLLTLADKLHVTPSAATQRLRSLGTLLLILTIIRENEIAAEVADNETVMNCNSQLMIILAHLGVEFSTVSSNLDYILSQILPSVTTHLSVDTDNKAYITDLAEKLFCRALKNGAQIDDGHIAGLVNNLEKYFQPLCEEVSLSRWSLITKLIHPYTTKNLRKRDFDDLYEKLVTYWFAIDKDERPSPDVAVKALTTTTDNRTIDLNDTAAITELSKRSSITVEESAQLRIAINFVAAAARHNVLGASTKLFALIKAAGPYCYRNLWEINEQDTTLLDTLLTHLRTNLVKISSSDSGEISSILNNIFRMLLSEFTYASILPRILKLCDNIPTSIWVQNLIRVLDPEKDHALVNILTTILDTSGTITLARYVKDAQFDLNALLDSRSLTPEDIILLYTCLPNECGAILHQQTLPPTTPAIGKQRKIANIPTQVLHIDSFTDLARHILNIWTDKAPQALIKLIPHLMAMLDGANITEYVENCLLRHMCETFNTSLTVNPKQWEIFKFIYERDENRQWINGSTLFSIDPLALAVATGIPSNVEWCLRNDIGNKHITMDLHRNTIIKNYEKLTIEQHLPDTQHLGLLELVCARDILLNSNDATNEVNSTKTEKQEAVESANRSQESENKDDGSSTDCNNEKNPAIADIVSIRQITYLLLKEGVVPASFRQPQLLDDSPEYMRTLLAIHMFFELFYPSNLSNEDIVHRLSTIATYDVNLFESLCLTIFERKNYLTLIENITPLNHDQLQQQGYFPPAQVPFLAQMKNEDKAKILLKESIKSFIEAICIFLCNGNVGSCHPKNYLLYAELSKYYETGISGVMIYHAMALHFLTQSLRMAKKQLQSIPNANTNERNRLEYIIRMLSSRTSKLAKKLLDTMLKTLDKLGNPRANKEIWPTLNNIYTALVTDDVTTSKPLVAYQAICGFLWEIHNRPQESQANTFSPTRAVGKSIKKVTSKVRGNNSNNASASLKDVVEYLLKEYTCMSKEKFAACQKVYEAYLEETQKVQQTAQEAINVDGTHESHNPW